MPNKQNISSSLYDLLTTRNFDPEVTDEQGQAAQPDEGVVFSFEYKSSAGRDYGTAVAVIDSEDQELSLYFGDNLGKSMEEPDKSEWFEFLQQLSQFATRNNFHTFSPKNLTQLKHTMAGMAAIREGLFESYYGNRRVSYQGDPTGARLVIEHNRPLAEDDARHRNIKSLFVETTEGERFKLPFVNLAGGRAMLEHVRQGGRPYDIRGVHIAEMIAELRLLNRFNRASAGRVMEGVTAELREQAATYYQSLRDSIRGLGTARGYHRYFESWSPASITDSEALVEDLKTLFVEQTIDARIEAALPLLAKIQQGTTMKEAEIFEAWANQVTEGTWAMPDTPEKISALKAFMGKEQPVGPDAVNAAEALYNIIGDDDLFDRLAELARFDPDADARIVVKDWILDHQFDDQWQDMLRPVSVELGADDQEQNLDMEPGDQEDEVREATRRVSGPHGDLEITDTATGKTVKRVSGYIDNQESRPIKHSNEFHMPVSTRSYRRPSDLDDVIDEGDNLATFTGPTEGAECNRTMEGEECPVHGLEECGVYEDGQDPMDRRGGVWDSFYEELDRIKTLALPKSHK